MAAKYAGNTFTCDGGRVTLTMAKINDQFCDCEDGADEPGTAACAGNTFYCQNDGYRVIELFSSRVDDGICDCCDGSDEGFVTKCPNTCEVVGLAEREAMAAKRAAYEVGSKTRSDYISQVKMSTVKELEKYEHLKPEKNLLEAELGTLRDTLARLETDVGSTTARLLKEARAANQDALFAAVRPHYYVSSRYRAVAPSSPNPSVGHPILTPTRFPH